MMYFWLIPLLLLLIIAIAFFFRERKPSTPGTSRLDKAMDERRGDLRD